MEIRWHFTLLILQKKPAPHPMHNCWLFIPSPVQPLCGPVCGVLLPLAMSVDDQQTAVNLICPESGVVCLAIPVILGKESLSPIALNRR